MPNKFAIGDKVIIERIDERTPLYILESLRLDHPRKIVAIFYDDKAQHTRYYLGSNKRGDVDLDSVHFRASQLRLWIKGDLGRPKEKRNYTRQTTQPENLLREPVMDFKETSIPVYCSEAKGSICAILTFHKGLSA